MSVSMVKDSAVIGKKIFQLEEEKYDPHGILDNFNHRSIDLNFPFIQLFECPVKNYMKNRLPPYSDNLILKLGVLS